MYTIFSLQTSDPFTLHSRNVDNLKQEALQREGCPIIWDDNGFGHIDGIPSYCIYQSSPSLRAYIGRVLVTAIVLALILGTAAAMLRQGMQDMRDVQTIHGSVKGGK